VSSFHDGFPGGGPRRQEDSATDLLHVESRRPGNSEPPIIKPELRQLFVVASFDRVGDFLLEPHHVTDVQPLLELGRVDPDLSTDTKRRQVAPVDQTTDGLLADSEPFRHLHDGKQGTISDNARHGHVLFFG
jgi:hypothetical protein